MDRISILFLLVQSFLLAKDAWYYFKKKIHVKSFGEQIDRLIMANNIDRAIKLCNSVPQAFAAQMVKRLLILAERPQELELSLQEIMLLTDAEKTKRKTELLNTVVFFCCWGSLMIFMIMFPEHSWITEVCIGGIILIQLGKIKISSLFKAYFLETLVYSIKIKNNLLQKAGYTPPQYRIRKMTEAEILQWRVHMEAFNQQVTQMRASGDNRPACDIYDEKAGKDGVLPGI